MFKMLKYHIMIDDKNLSTQVGSPAQIEKTVCSTLDLIEELNKYYYSYTEILSAEDEENYKRINKRIKKKIATQKQKEFFLKLDAKKNKRDCLITPAKSAHIEQVLTKLVDGGIIGTKMSLNPFCCEVFIYTTSNDSEVILTQNLSDVIFAH